MPGRRIRSRSCPVWKLVLGLILGGAAVLPAPSCAAAAPLPGPAEAPILHQLSHLFFFFSMSGLAVWIGRAGLAADAGWRAVRRAALFFVLWSADAFLVHWLETSVGLWAAPRPVSGPVSGSASGLEPVSGAGAIGPLGPLYDLARMDHLFLVPALICLYLGLRRLARTEGADPEFP